jgi:AraC family transcriptional regulator of adaptative response/methylated-DNA-[protein]-cysteine methyltransferase
VLVATTTKGVCAVSLGDSDEDLLASLRDEFPGADLAPAPPSTDPWVQQVVDYVDGRTPRQPIPLDVRATAFQWQVWSALRGIPWGETRTYGDIAQAIGRPRAARAVARACASNPVAVVVPCHRVVPAMGGEGGYRWGTSRKAALLARERRGRRDQTSTPTTS